MNLKPFSKTIALQTKRILLRGMSVTFYTRLSVLYEKEYRCSTRGI